MMQPILLTIALCSVTFFLVKEVRRLADDIKDARRLDNEVKEARRLADDLREQLKTKEK